MGSTTIVSWEDLPEELVSTIAKFVTPNSIDMLSFRSVCKSWYSSSPISPSIFSPMLPIKVPYPKHLSGFFYPLFGPPKKILPIISVSVIFAVRKGKQCWVMFADQLTPGKIMIRHSFTKRYYSRPRNFPKYLDVPHVHVHEISRFYNFSFHTMVNKPPSMWSEHVHKVVLNSNESVAVALFDDGQLGVLNLNLSKIIRDYAHAGWTVVFSPYGGGDACLIDDIVSYKGKILGVDRVGRVYEVGLPSTLYGCDVGFSLIGTALNAQSVVGSSTKRKRLVESNGFLYLVARGSFGEEGDGGERFKVFVLDQDFDDWVEVTSVDDRIFFFGPDFSFSVSPQEFGGSFGKDCIVYNKGSFRDYCKRVFDVDRDDDDVLFSNLRDVDRRIGKCPVWHMEDPCRCGVIGSYPGCTNILWPPPTWLGSVDMKKTKVY